MRLEIKFVFVKLSLAHLLTKINENTAKNDK